RFASSRYSPDNSSAMPAALASVEDGAAVNGDGLARNKAARVRREPQHGSDQVIRAQVALQRLAGFDSLQRLLGLCGEELARAFGHDRARRHGVDTDIVATKLARQTPSEADHRRLGRRVV